MKLTKNNLRERKIFNPHNLARRAGNQLYLEYWPAESGLASRCAQWVVCGIGIHTNPYAHWRDNGSMAFVVSCREEKEPKLAEAKAWVKERYGLDLTDKDPFGAWHVSGTLKKIQAQLEDKP